MVDTRVNLCGLALDNPVIPASGAFGFGAEFAEFYDINILGALCLKTVTREARFGNPTPRIAECPSGMLNSVGLQNEGVRHAVERELPALRSFFHKPVIASVGGFSVEEYQFCARELDRAEQVGVLELNISCPNVHAGGLNFGSAPESAAEVTRAVKEVTRKPVFVKLSPNVADIAQIAVACERAGADGISLINTLLGMRIDLKTKKPVLANTVGGLSGPAVFPVALRMVYEVAGAVGIPVMGIGGVAGAEDVLEMMLAGATAVQVGAANLRDPFACKRIIEGLPAAMEKYGIGSLSEIIGGVRK